MQLTVLYLTRPPNWWAALPADAHDRIRLGDAEVRLGAGVARIEAALTAFCPRESAVVRRYLDEVRACARAAPLFLLGHDRGPRAACRRWVDVTTGEHLRALGASDRLATLLTCNFGNYGSPPWRSSFFAHAVATGHYFDGAHVPVGGGGRIAGALVEAIVRRGGAVVIRAEVERILEVKSGLAPDGGAAPEGVRRLLHGCIRNWISSAIVQCTVSRPYSVCMSIND